MIQSEKICAMAGRLALRSGAVSGGGGHAEFDCTHAAVLKSSLSASFFCTSLRAMPTTKLGGKRSDDAREL